MPPTWIWQHPTWTNFVWDEVRVQQHLRRVWQKFGELTGKAGLVPNDAVELDTLLANLLASSAIEDEKLNAQSLRSSLARRLGVSDDQPYPISERSEGLAAIALDAITNRDHPVSLDRLFQWHHWLFPKNDGILYRIHVGQLRGDEPMQVVSGRLDKPVVHFEAPPRTHLDAELHQFITWFNGSTNQASLDPIVRAALCHFWFVTLHPFDDGNGRLARALTDMALAQADKSHVRLYAMSVAILDHRRDYYRILEQSQRGGPDLTDWLCWFLDILDETLQRSLAQMAQTLVKAKFWVLHRSTELSPGQIKVLNRLLDGGPTGFEEGISASQYQKVAKVSKATATRHLVDLFEKGCIEKMPGGGRSTRYRIKR